MPLLPLLTSGAVTEVQPHKNTRSTKVSTAKVGIDSATAINSAAHLVIRAPGADFPKTVAGFVMVSLTIL